MTKWDKISLLTDLAFKVNHLSDFPDKYKATEDDIRNGIRSQTLFKFLQEQHEKYPHLVNDFSYYTKEQLDYLYEILEGVDNCYLKEEDCCVKNNNYNFLLALVIMCMQTEISQLKEKDLPHFISNRKEEMELSIKERLILSYQLKILEKLYPEEKDYANDRKAIEDGYELHYDWIAEHLSKGLPKEECVFVLDVLEMYNSIKYSFQQINKPTKLKPDSVRFPGFDGNNETAYMAYTKYFIEDLDRFQDIKAENKNYNSHIQKIPKYKNMLEKWKNIEQNARYELTEEQISELLNTDGY